MKAKHSAGRVGSIELLGGQEWRARRSSQVRVYVCVSAEVLPEPSCGMTTSGHLLWALEATRSHWPAVAYCASEDDRQQ
jgi:hypothetical protein